MSYSNLLTEEGVTSAFLAVPIPSVKISSWTLFSGSTYQNTFNYGFVVDVKYDGTSLTQGSSSSLTDSQWYFDNDTKTLYIFAPGGVDPNSNGFITVYFELYWGTVDAHWFRDPTDINSEDAYFDPIISFAPSIRNTAREITFGFLPIKSTSITLNNAEHELEERLYNVSFSNKEIKIYHWLGEKLDAANINLVMRGKMSNVDYSDTTVSIEIFDPVEEFEKEFRHGTVNFINDTDFPNADPSYLTRPIPYIYGVVDDHVPINVDFVEEEPTTSDNRDWLIRGDSDNLYPKSAVVQAGATGTSCVVDDITGFKVDDSIKFNKTTPEYRHIRTIDYGTNTITYDSLASGAPALNDTIERGTIGNFDITKGGKLFRAQFGRDWTESVDAPTKTVIVNLSTSLESNLGMTENLAPGDQIGCRVYGKQNNVTLGGSPFGGEDTKLGNLTALPVILFDILVNFLGLPESEINTSSFTTLLGDTTEPIGFAIPKNRDSNFPKYKDLILDIIKSGFVKFYPDFSMLWKVTQTKPIGTISKSLDSEEILDKSIKYKFDYKDIASDFVVKYGFQEVSNNFKQVSQSSDIAKYLHEVTKSLTVESLHIFEEDAQLLADRLAFVFGDQQGEIKLDLKGRFFDEIIDSDLTVNRTRLPGFEFDKDIERSRNFSIIDIDKSLRQVRLIMTDQKGIEENSADWNG